jgi:hypothetical protein
VRRPVVAEIVGLAEGDLVGHYGHQAAVAGFGPAQRAVLGYWLRRVRKSRMESLPAADMLFDLELVSTEMAGPAAEQMRFEKPWERMSPRVTVHADLVIQIHWRSPYRRPSAEVFKFPEFQGVRQDYESGTAMNAKG